MNIIFTNTVNKEKGRKKERESTYSNRSLVSN